MATKNKKLNHNVAELRRVFNESFSSETEHNAENFQALLSNEGFSPADADQLFAYTEGKTDRLHIDESRFKMRKENTKRDAVVKRALPWLVISGAATAALISYISGSGLVGGSVVGGFIPVSGTPGFTDTVSAVTSIAGGTALVAGVIGGKNLITRKLHNLMSKNTRVDKNLESYNNISLEATPSAVLIRKIQAKQDEILSSNKAKGFIMSIVNRNRIHEIQALTIELSKRYNQIDRFSDNAIVDLANYYKTNILNAQTDAKKISAIKTLKNSRNFAPLNKILPFDLYDFIEENVDESTENFDLTLKTEALRPIFEMLENIENFMLDDIKKGKMKALMTTKSPKQKLLIEDVDIFTKTAITHEAIQKINATKSNAKFLLRDAKSKTGNVKFVKAKAYENAENEYKLITNPLRKHSTHAYSFLEEPIIEVEPTENSVIPPESNVNPAKKPSIVTVVPVVEPVVVPSSLDAEFNNGDVLPLSPIAGPLNCAETQIKNSKGQEVGIKLHFSNGKDYFEVEIRYMVTKKLIRIKFMTDATEHAEFVTINDTVIPPINQLRSIADKIKQHYNATTVEQPTVFDSIPEEFTFTE